MLSKSQQAQISVKAEYVDNIYIYIYIYYVVESISWDAQSIIMVDMIVYFTD